MKQRKSGKGKIYQTLTIQRDVNKGRERRNASVLKELLRARTLNKSHCITVNKAGKAYVMTTKELRVTENALFMKMPTKQHWKWCWHRKTGKKRLVCCERKGQFQFWFFMFLISLLFSTKEINREDPEVETVFIFYTGILIMSHAKQPGMPHCFISMIRIYFTTQTQHLLA